MISLEQLLDGSAAARNFDKLAQVVPDTGGQSVGFRFGTVTLTYTASAVSAAETVTHGLGKIPQCIVATGTTSASDRHVVNYVAASRDDATFQLQSEVADGSALSGSISAFWLAIG